jgi:hypothetical protein
MASLVVLDPETADRGTAEAFAALPTLADVQFVTGLVEEEAFLPQHVHPQLAPAGSRRLWNQHVASHEFLLRDEHRVALSILRTFLLEEWERDDSSLGYAFCPNLAGAKPSYAQYRAKVAAFSLTVATAGRLAGTLLTTQAAAHPFLQRLVLAVRLSVGSHAGCRGLLPPRLASDRATPHVVASEARLRAADTQPFRLNPLPAANVLGVTTLALPGVIRLTTGEGQLLTLLWGALQLTGGGADRRGKWGRLLAALEDQTRPVAADTEPSPLTTLLVGATPVPDHPRDGADAILARVVELVTAVFAPGHGPGPAQSSRWWRDTVDRLIRHEGPLRTLLARMLVERTHGATEALARLQRLWQRAPFFDGRLGPRAFVDASEAALQRDCGHDPTRYGAAVPGATLATVRQHWLIPLPTCVMPDATVLHPPVACWTALLAFCDAAAGAASRETPRALTFSLTADHAVQWSVQYPHPVGACTLELANAAVPCAAAAVVVKSVVVTGVHRGLVACDNPNAHILWRRQGRDAAVGRLAPALPPDLLAWIKHVEHTARTLAAAIARTNADALMETNHQAFEAACLLTSPPRQLDSVLLDGLSVPDTQTLLAHFQGTEARILALTCHRLHLQNAHFLSTRVD